MREDLAQLERLRERHRLCALAVHLRDSLRAREALEATSRASDTAVTALPEHARCASDADARSEAVRRVLDGPGDPVRRRLGELPRLEARLREDLRTLDAYRQRDRHEEAERRERARTRERGSGHGIGM